MFLFYLATMLVCWFGSLLAQERDVLFTLLKEEVYDILHHFMIFSVCLDSMKLDREDSILSEVRSVFFLFFR